MLRAVGIAGSPRRSGNSSTLLQAALEGAASAGAETRLVHLNDLTFRGCQACDQCGSAGRCVLDDELTPVLASLREADIWILATPIYFDSVTGQMKLFFDRCRGMTWGSGEHKPQLPGRRRAAIIATSEAHPYDAYLTALKSLASYFPWMGDFGEVAMMAEGGLGPADAVSKRPDLLDKARALGRRLVEDLTT
jgi:multimeric flavodoxin WrbA